MFSESCCWNPWNQVKAETEQSQRVGKADFGNYNQEPLSRTVNPPRSSTCAARWARFSFASTGPAALCLCVARGPLGTCLLRDHPCGQVTLSSQLTSSLRVALATGSSLDWKEFSLGTTHFEFNMESPFSGIRLLHRKRILLLLFMPSLLFSLTSVFLNKHKTYPNLDHQPGFCHSSFILSSELIPGEVCLGAQTFKQVIYFIYRYLRRHSFAIYREWK